MRLSFCGFFTCVCFSLLADVIVFVCCNVHTRNRNAVGALLPRLSWVPSTLRTLVEFELPELVGIVSAADAERTFIRALLEAEEAVIRSINDHIATMPA